jgi:serine/threonine-protein kinase
MFLLRTLGTVALLQQSPAGERHLDLQAKRLALLVFLLRSGRGELLRRDLLVALFWPEADEAHARGVLRQTLTAFRKQLGTEALVTHGEDEVGLARRVLTCDATAFEEANRQGDYHRACDLYAGDFLDSFHASGVAPEFEQWVADERARLRRLAGGAAWKCSDECEARAPAEAAAWARKATLLDPDNEAGFAQLIALLDRQGDRAGALAVYTALEQRLSEQYAADPSPETRALVQALLSRRAAIPAAAPVAPDQPPALSQIPSAVAAEPPLGGVAPPSSEKPFSRLIAAIVIGVLTLVIFAMVRPPGRPTDPSAVPRLAVLPFRVSMSDTTLSALREGMVDLLSIRMADAGPARIIDPGVVLAAWRQVVRSGDAGATDADLPRIAGRVGADRILSGSVTGSGSWISISASIRDVTDERILANAVVEGTPNNLSQLLDRLAGILLGEASGLEKDRLGALAVTPLPAIKAYLAGRAAVRRGQRVEALDNFRNAVFLDSTFAIAALELARVGAWIMPEDDLNQALRQAKAGRARLSLADRAFLDAYTHESASNAESFSYADRLVSAYPERPESWYLLGDRYFHEGQLAGIEDAPARAAEAFKRAWRLDSLSAEGTTIPVVTEPMQHMVELAHRRGDTAEVRRLTAFVMAADSTSDMANVLRWHMAVITGPAARAAYWNRAENLTQRTIMEISLFMIWTGIGLEDLKVAGAEDHRRLQAHDPGFRSIAYYFGAMNGGRPSQAPEIGDLEWRWRNQLKNALWWDGDTLAAATAALRLARSAAADPAGDTAGLAQQQDICQLGLWRLARGDRPAAESAARRLQGSRSPGIPAADSGVAYRYRELCGALLDAGVAIMAGRRDARIQIGIADSLARADLSAVSGDLNQANLILGSQWERIGDPVRALAAVRRHGGTIGSGPFFMTTFVREEARLSAATGDTARAIRCYRHYLGLRLNPEPGVQPEVNRVRQALAALTKQ